MIHPRPSNPGKTLPAITTMGPSWPAPSPRPGCGVFSALAEICFVKQRGGNHASYATPARRTKVARERPALSCTSVGVPLTPPAVGRSGAQLPKERREIPIPTEMEPRGTGPWGSSSSDAFWSDVLQLLSSVWGQQREPDLSVVLQNNPPPRARRDLGAAWTKSDDVRSACPQARAHLSLSPHGVTLP